MTMLSIIVKTKKGVCGLWTAVECGLWTAELTTGEHECGGVWSVDCCGDWRLCGPSEGRSMDSW
jgi:hypothetical protein